MDVKRRQTLIIAFTTIFSAWNTLMKETEIIWLAKSLWFIEAGNSCIRNHPSSVESKEKTSLDHCIKSQIFSFDSLLLFTTILFNNSNRLHFPWVSLPIKLSCNVRRTWKKKTCKYLPSSSWVPSFFSSCLTISCVLSFYYTGKPAQNIYALYCL